MAVIEIVDEVFGAARAEERRQARGRLTVEADRVSVRDLLRFRIEAEAERREDALMRFLRDRDARQEAEALNGANVRSRGFAGATSPSGPAERSDRIEKTLRTALDALVSGRLLLLVDGRQVDDPDETVHLEGAHEALFLRLIPLQGG